MLIVVDAEKLNKRIYKAIFLSKLSHIYMYIYKDTISLLECDAAFTTLVQKVLVGLQVGKQIGMQAVCRPTLVTHKRHHLGVGTHVHLQRI